MGVQQTRRWLLAVTIATAATICCIAVSVQLVSSLNQENQVAGIFHWAALALSVAGTCCCGALSLICFDILQHSPADSIPFRTVMGSYALLRKVHWYGPRIFQKFISGCSKVDTIQESILLALLNHNKDTVYGQLHNFEQIKSVKAFQNQHPLIRHKDIKPYIDQLADGAKNVLTKQEPLFFAKTSGTTGQPKLIPMTAYLLEVFAKDMMYTFGYMPISMGAKITLGKAIVLGHKPPVDVTKSGLLAAPLTYFYTRPSPSHTSPKPIYSITHENTAFYIHAIFALKEREVANMQLLFAHQAYSFFTFVEERWERLCDDIENNTISRDGLTIDETLYNDILREMQPDRERAYELRREFSQGSVRLAKRLWPGLSLCVVATTGTMAVYGRRIVETYLKDVIIVQNGYGASEGFFGMNLAAVTHDTNFILAYPYTFAEFIPEANIEEDQPTTVLAHEVKPGESYELVVTTGSGLYRYRTEDVIKITEMIEKCPVMEFQYRSGQILNLLGEKMTDITFYKSLCKTTERLGVALIDYTTCEDIHLHDIKDIEGYIRHYVLFVELTKKISEQEMEQFDLSLCEESQIYSGMRRNRQSVSAMEVIQVEHGAFLKLKDRMIEKTQNPQFKMPRALRDKEHLSFLLSQRLK